MLFLCVTQLLLLFRKLPQMKVILYKQRDPDQSFFQPLAHSRWLCVVLKFHLSLINSLNGWYYETVDFDGDRG